MGLHRLEGAHGGDLWAEATYEGADAVLHTSLEIQQHLNAQDAEIEGILGEIRLFRDHEI